MAHETYFVGVPYRDGTPFGHSLRKLENVTKGLAKASQAFSPLVYDDVTIRNVFRMVPSSNG